MFVGLLMVSNVSWIICRFKKIYWDTTVPLERNPFGMDSNMWDKKKENNLVVWHDDSLTLHLPWNIGYDKDTLHYFRAKFLSNPHLDYKCLAAPSLMSPE